MPIKKPFESGSNAGDEAGRNPLGREHRLCKCVTTFPLGCSIVTFNRMKRVISWNVNGIRAAEKKGLYDWFAGESPDVLCVQETKAQPDQLSEDFTDVPGYHVHWMSAEKKGYSGVAIYTKEKPRDVEALGVAQFDSEGRTCVVHLDDLSLISCYFPNSQPGGKRLEYKLEYCETIRKLCLKMRKNRRKFVICGDFNIAHEPIDLARPKQNEKSAGYLPEERAWMGTFLESGFLDSFRLFTAEGGHYTWWSYIGRSREKNVGWRIDYHCVPDFMRDDIVSSAILPDVAGSDHCPVIITLDV